MWVRALLRRAHWLWVRTMILHISGQTSLSPNAPLQLLPIQKSKVYGNADPALTYQVTSGSLAFTDAFTGALAREAGENVGTRAITQGTLALGTNYDLTYVGANLTITERAITVTADPKEQDLW